MSTENLENFVEPEIEPQVLSDNGHQHANGDGHRGLELHRILEVPQKL